MRREATIDIDAIPELPEVEATRRAYEVRWGRTPDDPGGWYRPDDWRRLSVVLASIPNGGRLLDVGAGAGQLVNSAVRSGRFDDVVAIDVGRFNKFDDHFDAGLELVIMPATLMSFDDGAFDAVTCLEVLEHVPDDAVERIVRELRRVCAGTLIVTVPFREARPRSSDHLRSFGRRDLARLFPDATLRVLSRRGAQWALVTAGPTSAPGRSWDEAAAAHRPALALARRSVLSARRKLLWSLGTARRRVSSVVAARRRS